MKATYRTQVEVDAAIDRYISLAIKWETRRDAAEFESITYWDCHDKAVEYHERARALMPKGS